MKVAAIVKFRNGPLIQFRIDRQLTQKAAAELAEISVGAWCCVESMDFRNAGAKAMERVSDLLDIPIEEICPSEMRGTKLGFSMTVFRRMEAEQLYAASQPRYALPECATAVDHKGLAKQFKRLLMSLTYREREIIKLRYGLDNGHAYTLEEVGKIFKVTRERVKQVEAKAIRKLQHPVRARKLQGFLEGELKDNDHRRTKASC